MQNGPLAQYLQTTARIQDMPLMCLPPEAPTIAFDLSGSLANFHIGKQSGESQCG
jgi:hypothetical protein